MKSLTEYLWFEVKGRRGFINITETVEDLVRRSGVKDGICLCNAMHMTGLFSSTTTKAASTTITSLAGKVQGRICCNKMGLGDAMPITGQVWRQALAFSFSKVVLSNRRLYIFLIVLNAHYYESLWVI